MYATRYVCMQPAMYVCNYDTLQSGDQHQINIRVTGDIDEVNETMPSR
jgi:hypothetical protein